MKTEGKWETSVKINGNHWEVDTNQGKWRKINHNQGNRRKSKIFWIILLQCDERLEFSWREGVGLWGKGPPHLKQPCFFAYHCRVSPFRRVVETKAQPSQKKMKQREIKKRKTRGKKNRFFENESRRDGDRMSEGFSFFCPPRPIL